MPPIYRGQKQSKICRHVPEKTGKKKNGQLGKNHFSEFESRNVFQNALGRGFTSTQKSAARSGHFHEVLTDADRVMTDSKEQQLLRSPPPVKRPKLSAAQFDQFTPSVQIPNSCSVPSNFTEKKTLVDQTPKWGCNSCWCGNIIWITSSVTWRFLWSQTFSAESESKERSVRSRTRTCYIEFYLQRDLVGQRRISEQLVGLFQCSVLCGDSVDWEEAVSNLQKATPTRRICY